LECKKSSKMKLISIKRRGMRKWWMLKESFNLQVVPTIGKHIGCMHLTKGGNILEY
jgi:hypothetical protein